MEKIKGTIVKGIGGLYEILAEDKSIITSRAKGSFRHDMISPTVGDRVIVEYDDKSALISSIEERKNLLIRPPLANLDYLFCTLPSRDPSPDIFTLDKLISIAESSDIEPVVIITKSDLDPISSAELKDIYEGAGLFVFTVSVYDEKSVDRLKAFINERARDSISAFAGASGAGKSTLMNMLFPSLSLATGGLSRKISRGKHTTRCASLYPLSTLLDSDAVGFLADTPGFTMLDFERFDFFGIEELPYTFREFDQYIGACRYTKCTHLCEEGCAIVEAVKCKDIALSRHQSYVALYNTLKARPPKSHKK